MSEWAIAALAEAASSWTCSRVTASTPTTSPAPHSYFDYQFDFVWWCVLIVAACESGSWVTGSAVCFTSPQWSPP